MMLVWTGRTSDELGTQETTDSDCGTAGCRAPAATAADGGDRPQLSATFMSSPQHWITSM